MLFPTCCLNFDLFYLGVVNAGTTGQCGVLTLFFGAFLICRGKTFSGAGALSGQPVVCDKKLPLDPPRIHLQTPSLVSCVALDWYIPPFLYCQQLDNVEPWRSSLVPLFAFKEKPPTIFPEHDKMPFLLLLQCIGVCWHWGGSTRQVKLNFSHSPSADSLDLRDTRRSLRPPPGY